MYNKEKDAAIDAILELADSNDVRFTTIMALSLQYIVERCIEEYDAEPPANWDTYDVMQSMESALQSAYRNTLLEIVITKSVRL